MLRATVCCGIRSRSRSAARARRRRRRSRAACTIRGNSAFAAVRRAIIRSRSSARVGVRRPRRFLSSAISVTSLLSYTLFGIVGQDPGRRVCHVAANRPTDVPLCGSPDRAFSECAWSSRAGPGGSGSCVPRWRRAADSCRPHRLLGPRRSLREGGAPPAGRARARPAEPRLPARCHSRPTRRGTHR